ncbi:hypothetical protein [Corynebacterium liangguodongii]|uniref:Uncharacterized protein n=1 Tax=Corynebacterium liangguodongii TaxID=2079535 RepID=A0A2S0WCT3_9CORY|nr:hypothetical protein [Corynebacterium liangguodongii]AWB83482.1 hypothetical protein C3E79_02405 [Corynebacterium liangguodongii]PWC00429.1 hypothetical protein DF219_00550 [Corynebacterium liangguodongii]
MTLFLGPRTSPSPVAAVLAASIISAGGRFLALSGTTWTVLAAVALGAFTAWRASQWPALNQLGASFRRWLRGGLGFVAVSALVLTAATVAAGQVNMARNPWYSMFDIFIITDGSAPYLDTYSAPYMVDDAGQTAGTIVLGVLLTFALFCVAGLAGIAIGLASKDRTAAIILVTSAALAGLCAGIALASLGETVEIAGEVLHETSPNAGAVAAAIVLAILAPGAAWVIARAQRYCP